MNNLIVGSTKVVVNPDGPSVFECVRRFNAAVTGIDAAYQAGTLRWVDAEIWKIDLETEYFAVIARSTADAAAACDRTLARVEALATKGQPDECPAD